MFFFGFFCECITQQMLKICGHHVEERNGGRRRRESGRKEGERKGEIKARKKAESSSESVGWRLVGQAISWLTPRNTSSIVTGGRFKKPADGSSRCGRPPLAIPEPDFPISPRIRTILSSCLDPKPGSAPRPFSLPRPLFPSYDYFIVFFFLNS